MKRVLIVNTGLANTASIIAALTRAGAICELSQDAQQLLEADYVVLPGVGAFAAGMQMLNRFRLIEPIRERISNNQKTLAICLGFQLLFSASEEGPGVNGIGVFPERIVRFPDNVMTPQFGWNRVEASDSFLSSGYAYYANSYCAPSCQAAEKRAWSEYGHKFVAALSYKKLTACQFHPELSAEFGAQIISSWLEQE